MSRQAKTWQTDSAQTCLHCGERMRPARHDLVFQTDGLIISVKNVPVQRCDACDEQFVSGPIGLEISDAVDRVVRDGRLHREARSH